jgi:ABC-type transport system involved in multi-copper enzyme maturation permease subunit
MFRTLLIKEWKEKAPIAVFGLGLMALFLVALLIIGGDRDLRELIPAAFLIIFFPFIGVMLGAGAFESEFRNGSWAYLLSRPVRKETIWLAKLTALLSIMAGFWLIFLGLMAVLPGLSEVVAGYKLPEIIEGGLRFFPLVLLSSVFYFSVAFSLSILSERQLSIAFGSFFVAFALQGLMSWFAFMVAGRGELFSAGWFPWAGAYKLAMILSGLAFLAASLLTFRKADFSQPNKKTWILAKFSAVFLAAAWLLAAAWPATRPGPKLELVSGIDVVGGQAFFSTTRGMYRYDMTRDKLDQIAKWRSEDPYYLIGGGKVLYSASPRELEEPPLRVMNTDGSGKRLLVGDDLGGLSAVDFLRSYILSPDGQTAVIVARGPQTRARQNLKRSLWSVRTDGTGQKQLLPLDPALDGQDGSVSWLMPIGWLKSSDKLLIQKHSQEMLTSLWTYDMVSGVQARLFESPYLRSISISPSFDLAIMVDKLERRGPFRLSTLNLTTAEMLTVAEMTEFGEAAVYSRVLLHEGFWNSAGDRIAFLVQKARGIFSPGVYSLAEQRFTAARTFPAAEGSSQKEPSYLVPSIDWIKGDTNLVLGVPKERCVKILGRELTEEKTIAVPASVGNVYVICAANDIVLLQDFDNVAVWRLDLKTEKWKKIW